MTTQKVSVTLTTGSVERARALAGPRGLSAYVDAALERKLDEDERRADALAFLAELEAADPSPAEVREEATRRAEAILAAIS